MLTGRVSRVILARYRGAGDVNGSWKQPINSRLMRHSGAPDEEETKPPKALKQWRRPWDDGTGNLTTKLKVFDRGGRPSADLLAVLNQPWDLSPSSIKRWWNKRRNELDVHDQRYVPERHEILGSNLAASHFLVHRGARVKFVGRSDWVERDETGKYTLPSKYHPNYLLEAVDAGGMKLFYDGLDNMRYLHELKWLSLRGCGTIDDWCLDRISSRYTKLEYLDISNCEKVTERGLEALYRMHSLKKLIVTNRHASAAFELTCMMLEDCNRKLICEIRQHEEKTEHVEAHA